MYIKEFTCFFRIVVDFELIDYKKISIFSFFFVCFQNLVEYFLSEGYEAKFQTKNETFFYYFKQRIFLARINKQEVLHPEWK